MSSPMTANGVLFTLSEERQDDVRALMLQIDGSEFTPSDTSSSLYLVAAPR